ncbi:MAG: hypothetical protein ABR974_13925 [Bacteroidales bacterium]|jgi:hypothetical protein
MRFIPIIFLVLFSVKISGQNWGSLRKRDLVILKDSLWIKHNLWKLANTANLFNEGKTYFDSSILNISFIDIPVFKFKPEAVNYNYGLSLFSFLEKDSSRVEGLIVKNDTLIGHLRGYLKDKTWNTIGADIFDKKSPPYLIYETLNNKIKKSIYTISPIGFLWYNNNDSTFVIVPFSNRPIPAETLIKNYVTIETIHEWAKTGDYSCIKNNK